ncbi:MAG: hypothetical protein ABIN74_05725 [Ferruginibacter sp.]
MTCNFSSFIFFNPVLKPGYLINGIPKTGSKKKEIKMKKSIILSIFIFSVAVQYAQGQTADEIISKNIEAMGGRQKILTLSSALMTGTFTAAGSPAINITVTKKHLVGSRIDIEVNGIKNYQLITPTNGWIYTPVQGDQEPRPLQEGQVKAGQVQLDLHGPFLDHKEKGIKIEMTGKDTVNGSTCYKLQVSAPNGNVTIYSIDSKSYFIVKTSNKMFQYAAWEDVITTYGDYRKNADGFWFAYNFTSPRGDTKYENIVANVPVSDDLFKIK